MTDNDEILSFDNEYSLLMSAMNVSVSKHIMNEDFTVIWANDYYYEKIGYEREEYEAIYHNSVKNYYKDYIDIYQKISETIMAAIENDDSGYDCICQMPQKNGNMIWIKIRGLFTGEMYGDDRVIYTVFTDITDLVQSEKEKSIAYDKLPGFVAKFRIKADKRYELLDSNERFSHFFGKEVYPERLNIMHMDVREAFELGYQKMSMRQPLQFECSSIGGDGKEYWFQVNGEYVDDVENEPIYLFVFIDITEQTKNRKMIEELAFVDPITGGYNRSHFEVDMKKYLMNNKYKQYYFISLDIEKFKALNDLAGIEKGDSVLHYIYDSLAGWIVEDECVGRFAADKFIALIHADSDEEIVHRINEAIKIINSFNDSVDNKYYLNFKAGVYRIIDNSLQFATMYDRANMAIKNAKYTSESQMVSIAFYTNVDRLNLMKEKEIENKLGNALINNEFVVYLQPKVSVSTKEILGAEALVRWNDPEDGLIYPDAFIPILENNGSIVKLDLYVFEKVCQMLRKWMDNGYQPIQISVNMSRAHIANVHFIKQYEKIRKAYDIPSQFIDFELTETMIFDNPEVFKRVIHIIHKAGYTCSMDDFGSGYSSLNILRDLKFDTLKLDRTFFSFENDKRGEDIIESVLLMSDKLNMTSVAEGVETKKQVSFLENTECDLIQGYVYSKPIPLNEFEKLKYGIEI